MAEKIAPTVMGKTGIYQLQLLKNGEPVAGKEFEVTALNFEQIYKAKTAKPDGVLEKAEAKYVVKKKPLVKRHKRKK